MLPLTAVLFNDYIVKSEENASMGWADSVLIQKRGRTRFGHRGQGPDAALSKSKLQNSAKTALRQILKQDYGSRLRERGVSDILAYGVSFFKNKVYVASELLS